jgi:hypothetical protein
VTAWKESADGYGIMAAWEGGRRRALELNEIMDFGVVVWSVGDGSLYDETPLRAPDLTPSLSDDELEREAGRQGWLLLKGWTGQYGYRGPRMHPSEFVGGGMAKFILETPGFYATVPLLAGDEEGEEQDDGWVVAYRLNPYNPDDFPREKER